MIGERVTLVREVRTDLPGEVTLSKNLKEKELPRGGSGGTILQKGGTARRFSARLRTHSSQMSPVAIT